MMNDIKYVLGAFAYPSGNIHMGHARVYTIVNAISNTLKIIGKYEIFCPVGFDSMGLPAETAAIEHNIDPYKWIKQCTNTMMTDYNAMQFEFATNAYIDTSDYHYAKMEQIIFQEMFKKGLVYYGYKSIPFCYKCNTTLSKEQSIQNLCWRCDSLVEYINLKQVFINISSYAEKLFNGLKNLNQGWGKDIINKQKVWLGKYNENQIFEPFIHDWCVSREKSFGIPIPLSECKLCGLFIENVEKYTLNDWPCQISDMKYRNTICNQCNKPALKLPFTLDTFFDSSWYMNRFWDVNHTSPVPYDASPIDFYICGKEHTNLHLIYARFMQLFLFENNFVQYKEPFKYLVTQGLVLAESIFCTKCRKYNCLEHEEFIERKISKMSKSKKNGISPNELLTEYSADVIKFSLLFLGPVNSDIIWNKSSLTGVNKLLNNFNNTRFTYIDDISSCEQYVSINQKIDSILDNSFKKLYKSLFDKTYIFNVIAAQLFTTYNLMKLNQYYINKFTLKNYLKLLYIYAPNLAKKKYYELFEENIT